MLTIPDYTSQHVVLSQYMGSKARWQKFEQSLDAIFKAQSRSIYVQPTRFDGYRLGHFTVAMKDVEGAAFRHRIWSPDKWAVMYISNKSGDVRDVTDSWLACFEQQFNIIMPHYSRNMLQNRRAAMLQDGVVAKVADAALFGTSPIIKIGSVAMATSSQVVPYSEKYAAATRETVAGMPRKSLRDPLNVEGCAGVDAKRDALMRRMFG